MKLSCTPVHSDSSASECTPVHLYTQTPLLQISGGACGLVLTANAIMFLTILGFFIAFDGDDVQYSVWWGERVKTGSIIHHWKLSFQQWKVKTIANKSTVLNKLKYGDSVVKVCYKWTFSPTLSYPLVSISHVSKCIISRKFCDIHCMDKCSPE